jgi:hypothetical protein
MALLQRKVHSVSLTISSGWADKMAGRLLIPGCDHLSLRVSTQAR